MAVWLGNVAKVNIAPDFQFDIAVDQIHHGVQWSGIDTNFWPLWQQDTCPPKKFPLTTWPSDKAGKFLHPGK